MLSDEDKKYLNTELDFLKENKVIRFMYGKTIKDLLFSSALYGMALGIAILTILIKITN